MKILNFHDTYLQKMKKEFQFANRLILHVIYRYGRNDYLLSKEEKDIDKDYKRIVANILSSERFVERLPYTGKKYENPILGRWNSFMWMKKYIPSYVVEKCVDAIREYDDK